MPTECPSGSGDVVRLFNECRMHDRMHEGAGRRLPIITLLGTRGSGKSATLRWLGYLASSRPSAFCDFASASPKRPHEVAARLALGLSYRFPGQPAVHFPRLALGLLAISTPLNLNGADARRVRAELRRALRQVRQDAGQQVADTVGEVAGVVQDLNLVPLPGLSLVLKVIQFGLPRLPVAVLHRTGLAWYADGPLVPVDALMQLNEWASSQTEEDAEKVDRRLCGAFLEDLRDHYAKHEWDRKCVALLDNLDEEEAWTSPRCPGRAFLDTLVRVREANETAGRGPDPLLIVATTANARMVPGPYASGHPAELRMRTPEEASYKDWQSSIPRPAPDTSWHWYPVRLRDLTEPEVRALAEEKAGALTRSTPLVHRLSYGHPWSVRALLDAAHTVVVERGGQAAQLRRILDAVTPVPGRTEGPLPLDEAARHYLLRDLTDGQRAALIVCSAARSFESAVDAGLLEEYDQFAKATLLRDVDARLWLVPPVPEDAGTRGGWGSGYLDHCRKNKEESRPADVLQPWLRLVLLRALAQHEPEGSAGWTTVHGALRTWHQNHPGTQRNRLDAYYHALALNELDEIVTYFVGRLRQVAGIHEWLYELYAITAAPMITPPLPSSGSVGDGSTPPPQDWVRDLAHRLAPAALHEYGSLTMLVTALWLAAEPRNRTALTPELNSTISASFNGLVSPSHSFSSGLSVEAERYNPRP